MHNWPQALLSCVTKNQLYPSVSEEYPKTAVNDAYALQKQFVMALEDTSVLGEIAGFKAALTAKPAQSAMAVEDSIVGVLFSSGEQHPNSTLVLDRPTLLETEIGFSVGRKIDRCVTVEDVPTFIESYMPIIELAAPNLAQRPNGIDLIATNAASYGFIKGAAANAALDEQIDRIKISQSYNGERLYAAHAGEVMGGQIKALTWLINQVIDLGYEIYPGHLLITGSIGAMAPAQPGHYRANFAQLGDIEFDIP